MSDYLRKQKNENESRPSSFLLRNGDGDIQSGRRLKLPPNESETSSGFVGTEPTTSAEPVNQPQQPQTPTFSDQPSVIDKTAELIKNGSLINSPYYQQILANQTKLTSLKMQPSYTKMKDGNPVLGKDGKPVVVQGMEDKDGRIQSGLKGLVAGLANFNQGGPVRDWNDFSARLTGTIVRGVGGTIVPEWNEIADRQNEIKRIEQENEGLVGNLELESKLKSQASIITDREADNARQAEQLKQKKRVDFRRANPTFDPTKASEAQVKQLAEIGETPMSIGHYDFTKADIKWINGQAWKKDTSGAFTLAGLPTKENESLVEYKVKDPDTDVETTYLVPQQKAAQLKTNLASAGLQIQAANERQANSQQFTLTRDEIERKARIQAKELDAKLGRTEMIAKEKAAFVKDFQKENGKPPTEAEINKYLEALDAILK